MLLTFSRLAHDLASALAEFLDPFEARSEADRWFEEGLGWTRARLAAHGDEVAPEETRARIEAWLQRRREGEPWAYILGWTLFRGRRFQVDRSVLIPRPETELVLEAALEVGRRLGVDRACDVGTGSGILGISMALETSWEVAATDLSEGALRTARRNAGSLGARMAFHCGDLLDPLPGPLGLVVSNPPYVDPGERGQLARELAWEPEEALFAADGGLAVATGLLRQARMRSAPGCVMEIGAGQGRELCRRGREFGWRRIAVHLDLAGHDRILMALA